MSVKHTKVSTKADSSDTELVRPSDWNAEHTVALTDAEIPATIARDAEVTADIATHAALPTVHQDAPALIAVHAALPIVHQDAPALIGTHAALSQNVHGVGANDIADVADIATHSGLDTGIHGVGGSTVASVGDIATHTAILDAHTFNWMEKLYVGAVIPPLPITESAQRTVTANKICAIPFPCSRDITIDTTYVKVGALDAGKIARLGYYNDNGACYPNALVEDIGTLSVGANGIITIAEDVSLSKGLNWIVFVSDGVPGMGVQYFAWSPLGYLPTQLTPTWSYCLVKAGVGSGALAANFPGGATLEALYIPAVFVKIKSLD